ncbi:MAG TPA: hypothetical protein VFS00_18180, partial [Polyangiaceae bacterium]|nr:hypothetical protein [Polyangiaceae bacterium]
MSQLVNALFLDQPSVQHAVAGLVELGYCRDDIVVLTPEPHLSRREDAGVEVSHADKTARGAAIGGAIGATLAASVAAAFFVDTGPWPAFFAGIGAGGLGGSLFGALVGSILKASRASHGALASDKGGTVVAVQVAEDRSQAIQYL